MTNKGKSKKSAKQQTSAKQVTAHNGSNHANTAPAINGSMSRMANPSVPKYPEVKMWTNKIFRPYTGWTVGPVGSSVALCRNINFSLDEFFSQQMASSWEAVRLDRIECFWGIQQTNFLVPSIVWSSVDPALLASDAGVTSFQSVFARQNLQQTQLNQFTSFVKIADFVPVPILDDSANATLVPTTLYKKQWLSAADVSVIKFNGLRVAHLLLSNPYTQPSAQPASVLMCRLHVTYRGKAVDTNAYYTVDVQDPSVGERTLPPIGSQRNFPLAGQCPPIVMM